MLPARIRWPNARACLFAQNAEITVSGKKVSVKMPSHTWKSSKNNFAILCSGIVTMEND
jgi:hypothetical protein